MNKAEKFFARMAIKRIFKSKNMKNILVNWKTSLGGIGAALVAAGLAFEALQDGFQGSDVDVIMAAVGAITAAFGLFQARDSDKSSQDNGIRP